MTFARNDATTLSKRSAFPCRCSIRFDSSPVTSDNLLLVRRLRLLVRCRKDFTRFGRKRVSRSDARAKKQAPKYTLALANLLEKTRFFDASVRVPRSIGKARRVVAFQRLRSSHSARSWLSEQKFPRVRGTSIVEQQIILQTR